MSEFQFSCLVLVLFSLIMLVGYLMYRVRSLQIQCDEFRCELLHVKAECWKVIRW